MKREGVEAPRRKKGERPSDDCCTGDSISIATSHCTGLLVVGADLPEKLRRGDDFGFEGDNAILARGDLAKHQRPMKEGR
jgi:hypothetical protein